MGRVLILKTGALGDVLRSTSLLPGLAQGGAEVHWVTGPGAQALLEGHPLIEALEELDPDDPQQVAAALERLRGGGFERVLSLDDEVPLCRIASEVAAATDARITGAHLDPSGSRTYSEDAEAWFGMGLLAKAGLEEADRRKLANRASHAALLAKIVGVEAGRPALHLDPREERAGELLAQQVSPAGEGPLIGLNTGAGGRWRTKAMLPEEVGRLAQVLVDELPVPPRFLLLGGAAERERNQQLAGHIRQSVGGERVVEAPTDLGLREFAALIGALDLLVTSDSLALHMGVALDRPIVAFFAPTSPHEIDLFGLGEKVVSTAPDAGSYRTDADNRSITGARVGEACVRVLASRG